MSAFAEHVLANVREEIRAEVAYALELAGEPELLGSLKEAAEFVRRYEQPIESPARSYWLRVRDVTAAAIARAEGL